MPINYEELSALALKDWEETATIAAEAVNRLVLLTNLIDTCDENLAKQHGRTPLRADELVTLAKRLGSRLRNRATFRSKE